MNPFRRGRAGVRIPPQRSHFPVAVDAEPAPSAGVPTARGGVVAARTRFSFLKGGGAAARDAVAQSSRGPASGSVVAAALVMDPS